ncbi:NADPH-dependent FMN reductase [Aquimarina brevivitae]|uniref:NAD(P)H-dependent FMN reductase n=1 Tax=Aquimarina brevivitae TaxID=323412 RepID=A0A4Q7NYQ5_9FLAO|nr:NADPH-dependent FMN reductase [Aquimarina brevivitae]RZS92563.1 NAD(P)H-dependent FMN reductase [Aquimarina brevivitae]
MKKILAFAGSNSSNSINQKLVSYVASRFKAHTVKVLRLSDYNFPMYSEDAEREGFPGMGLGLKQDIKDADALIIAVNEHNGSWSAFFKNIVDWLSRIDRNFLEGKKILLMSTSPGKRGGLSSLEFAKLVLPRFGAEIVESFSFPSFYENYDEKAQQITNETLLLGLNEVLSTFEHQINT